MTLYKPKDIIALFTMFIFALMKLKGIDGSLDTVVALVLGYYFGHRMSKVDNGE